MAKSLESLLGGRAMVITLVVALAAFMENLDATIIVTALPQMAEAFGVTPARMGIGVTAYVLALAAGIPAGGWLADRFGTRNVFCAAIGLFTLASLLCGAAPSFATFIAARVLQGAASAMMSPVGRLVVLRNTEKSQLMRALSTLVWPALLAPVIGPPLGGFIATFASWRWIFYANLPVGLIGMALAAALIPNERRPTPRPFDTAGFLLMAVALACLTYGLDVAGSREPAFALAAGLVLVAGALGFLAYRHVETTPNPVLKLAAFKAKTFFVSCLSGGLLSRAAISATPFLLPLMFQVGFGLSPVASGGLLLIYMGANLAMKALTNPILRRFGIRNTLVVNGVIASAGIGLCALIPAGTPLVLTGAILVVAGASRSMNFTALAMVTYADVPAEERTSATVLASLTQQIGMGMGVAVGALMLNFSQAVRGAAELAVFDFRLALVLAGLISLGAVIPYLGLPRDAGAEISGHKARAS